MDGKKRSVRGHERGWWVVIVAASIALFLSQGHRLGRRLDGQRPWEVRPRSLPWRRAAMTTTAERKSAVASDRAMEGDHDSVPHPVVRELYRIFRSVSSNPRTASCCTPTS